MTPRSTSVLLLPALTLVAAIACMSAEDYVREADEEVYALIEARRSQLIAGPDAFRIDPDPDSLRQRLLRGEVQGTQTLSLVEALEIAAENSRDFQDQKESLYLAALDLTLEQWRFQNQYGGGGTANLDGDGNGAENASADSSFSLSRLLGTGAQIVGDIGTSLFRVVSTGDGWDVVSDLGISVTQPLLRGAGEAIVREPLTQAERDLLYQVRAFERFRRTFAVDVVRRYLGILLSMENLKNERLNHESLATLRRRNEAFAEAGQETDIEVDRARQDELRSANRILELEAQIQGQLDEFKVFLGLPVEAQIEVDPGELDRMIEIFEESEVLESLDEQAVLDLAYAHRLDYLTTVDRIVDAERRIRVAEDALEAGLDFSASVNLTSAEGRPLEFRSDAMPWSAGFSLDLPIDQLPERNTLRRALIDYQAALRQVEEQSDRIRSTLRDRIRNLYALRRGYELQETAVRLAERRVESARLNLEAGRAETFDVLQAQESLVASQNALKQDLVDYALARLDLYLELELLEVDESGIRVDTEALRGRLQPPGEDAEGDRDE